MPSRAAWLRSLVSVAVCGSFALSAAAQPGAAPTPDGGELWEKQVREGLRRDILLREQQLWDVAADTASPAAARDETVTPPEVSPPQPPATALLGGSGAGTLFAPLASLAQRTRAAWLYDPGFSIELSAAVAIERAAGLEPTARELTEIAARLSPDDARSWRHSNLPYRDPGRPLAAIRSLEYAPPPDRLRRAVPSDPLEAMPPAGSAAEVVPGTALGDVVALAGQQLVVEWAESRFGFAALGALAVVAVLFMIRRRGDLTVQIVYPQELRGSFRVRLDRSAARARRRRPVSDREILKGGTASSREHQLVARETSFARLSCGRYYVTVEGVLQDPRDGSSVAHRFLQGSATVLHRRTVRLDVDATPGACPVDVKVTWDGKAVPDALVAARGHTGGSVEVVQGRVRLHLPRGEYLIVAGASDRVVERPLRVRSHLPTQLSVDLGSDESIVFKACPPAVEPYLSGQLETAADQLARDGQPQRAHRLLGRRCHEHGRIAEAALHFEAAGTLDLAAELQSDLGNYLHAGELFERSNDLLSAAEMYQLSGEEVRAGRAYEAARDFENAIDCFRSAGDVASWVEALNRRGDVFEAARTALDNGLPTRGIRLLQRISSEDSSYRDACALLADAFERESHFDVAAGKLAEYVAAADREEVAPRTYARLAELHEKAGDLESALEVLETLRLLDPAYPNLATQADQLRKARSEQRQLEARRSRDDPSQAPTVMLPIQRYEQLEELGRGGMGIVYKARDRRLGRIVALKRLSENLREHPHAVEMFLREARAAAALNHPNIVIVYDADQDDDKLFITMELLEGHPLRRLLRQRGCLSTVEVARIGTQVCDGLEYAHVRGVIHRDIKTANLFLTTDQHIKIMDFGLAKLVEEVRRGASLIGGTPNYMAPEQTDGAKVDHRADLYALGATLFELATGEVPFATGDTPYPTRHGAPRDPRAVAPDLDPRLAALIVELLDPDPERRPPSAAATGLRLAALEASG